MKLKTLKFKLALVLVLLFSLFLHIFRVVDNPPSLYSDESDINYQAYVFNNCHTDYFGNKFPIHFHSFSDWQPGLYIYSVALAQKFIGHTDIAARLPAAIFGTLTILIFYLILKKILKNRILAIVGAFLLTISPWLIHFSRIGFAVTAMLFFLLLGIYFWIKFLSDSKNKLLYLSVMCFSFSLYTYSTAKLHLILIFLTIFILWFKKIIHLPLKTKIFSLLLVILISLPVISDTLQGRAGYRFSYINIFSDPSVSKTVDNFRLEDSKLIYRSQPIIKTSFISKIFDNKVTQWSTVFFENYFKSFSTEFLFLNGDSNPRQGFKNIGYLFYPDLFFLIVGLTVVFNKKKSNEDLKIPLFFIISLILVPVPFALTRDSSSAHATRLILMLPFIIYFSLLGMIQITSKIKSKIALPLILSIYILCFTSFYHQYFYHYPYFSARSWHMGMKEVVLTVKQEQNNWEQIYFSSSFEPFMPFFLNYNEYLPHNEFKCLPAQSFLWDNTNYFTGMQSENKYYMGIIEWSPLLVSKPNQNNLFVVTNEDLIKVKNSLESHNHTDAKRINYNIVKKFSKRFTEQEEFYLISFNYEQ